MEFRHSINQRGHSRLGSFSVDSRIAIRSKQGEVAYSTADAEELLKSICHLTFVATDQAC